MIKELWTVWCLALGEKLGHDAQADKIAWIRTIILIQVITTNGFIISSVIRHW